MQPFVFEKQKPTWSHDHQQSFKLILKFAASTVPRLFPPPSWNVHRSHFPYARVCHRRPSWVPRWAKQWRHPHCFHIRHVTATLRCHCQHCRPPHHSPGLPPPFSTATSPQWQSPKVCHPIGAPPLIEGCGHPNQGGTGPRILDRGVVGRSNRQASKKKNGPPQKSWSNRHFYHFKSKYEIYMCNISHSDIKNGEYSHIFNDSSPWLINWPSCGCVILIV